MNTLLLVVFGFLLGSLPFSYWIGRFALKQDIRQVGDGNPGATNVLRAGGRRWAMIAAVLDGLKGTIPVGIAYFRLELTGLDMALVALAPVLGHAFSPFLHFKGGKAVAVTFGVWAGMTLWQVPVVMGFLLLFWVKVIRISGLALMLTLVSTLVYLLIFRPEPVLLMTMIGLLVILGWKHRHALSKPQSAQPTPPQVTTP
jgi:glycerol-3-phosphate acyltransferase PlsY